MTGPAAEGSSPGGELYRAFIERQVTDQNVRKASLEQRGIAVITTSGALVTLLFALVATITKTEGYVLPSAARYPLYGAIALFVLAAIAAITANVPLSYQTANVDALQAAVRDFWDDSEATAGRRIAATDLKVLRAAKRANQLKAYILMWALIVEVVAVGFVGLSVGITLYRS
jgi:hypothetical protein